MILPALKDDALLADISAADGGETDFHLWWLGQSGFLLKWAGRFALLDPYLSDSLTKKYASTDKPHVRMSERCLSPEHLGFVQVVTASHAHTDHLDGETLRAVAAAVHAASRPPLPLVLPAAIISTAQERLLEIPFAPHGLDAGITIAVGGFEFTGIPAAHNTIERDDQGRCRFLGFIIRFGPWCVYHSGDTLWHEQLPALLFAHQPDVVLVPINGSDPARRVAGNLNGAEAAALAQVCSASVAIPHHYDMFTFNTASPDLFVTECARLGQHCEVMRIGGRWSSAGLTPRGRL